MKISVIVATRGRPHRAAGVIECARNFLCGAHDVQFIVALDADDQLSIDYFASCGSCGITSYVQPRPIGIGDAWNRAAKAFPADFYLALPDDAWICTPYWDAIMIQILMVGPHPIPVKLGIVGWMDPLQPAVCSIFGMTQKWIDVNGHIFDPRYPFWWGDVALVETAIFATAEGMPGTDQLKFASQPGNFNPHLRDMELWWAFFAATRHERIATARRLGMPPVDDDMMELLVKECEERDAMGIRQIPQVLATIHHPAPPTKEYLIAKAQAETYLRDAAIEAPRAA
jgi:hypothetical protein